MDQSEGDVGPTRRVLAVVGDTGERILGERPTMEHVLLLLFLGAGAYMYYGADEFAASAATFPRLMAGATVILSALILARNHLPVVAPVFAVVLGAYFAYTGGMTYLEHGSGLEDRSGLLTLVGGSVLFGVGVVFRESLGNSVRSFVAEPLQLMGDDDTDMGKPPVDGEDETEADAESEGSDEDGPTSGAMYVYEIDDREGPIVTGLLCIAYMGLTFTIGMLYATPIFVAAYALWARMETVRLVALTVVSFVTAYGFYRVISDDIAEGWYTGWEPTPPDFIFEPIIDTVWFVVDLIVSNIQYIVGQVVMVG